MEVFAIPYGYSIIDNIQYCSGGDLAVGNLWGNGNDGEHCPLIGNITPEQSINESKKKGFIARHESRLFLVFIYNWE